MPKIIFTVTNDLTYDRRMLRIGSSLAKAGYEVMLVGRVSNNSQPFKNQYIKHKRFKLFFNKGKLFYIEYNLRLFIWLLFQRFDIVCGVDLDTIVPCYWASILSRPVVMKRNASRGGKTCVYDAHELFSEVPEVISRPRIHQFWLGVERYIVPKIKHQYTVSQSIVEEFKSRYNVDFQLIRNLPFRQISVLPITLHPSPILLYQGALNEGRGIETAIEAMQHIENAELWLVGEGDLSEMLRGSVREKGLEQKVKFLGYITPDKLHDITLQATIGLNIPENKGLSYYYSLPNKFLDYIQAELPQISVDWVEFQRLNDEYDVALLIPKTDIDTVVHAIKHLLDDSVYYHQLKENCRKAAEVLCWEEEEKKLIAFYENL
jgi:glycosyltransferase involved in cell wall biosynthesis